MSNSTNPSAPSTAPLAPRDFALLCTALVSQWSIANAEKGDRKARSIDAVRTYGASLLTELLASDNPHGARVSVRCSTKERGIERVDDITCYVVSVLKAVVFGGCVVGASKLSK
jgi:hypothetical protein